MAIYEFICHNCEVIWEREAPMSKAPSRSRCPECKKLSERHWGDVPVMFNGSDYYTNKRKNHNLVYKDKAKSKEIQENLLDATKRMGEDTRCPYKRYTLSQKGFEQLQSQGAIRRKTSEESKRGKEVIDNMRKTNYNNSEAYRKLKPNN